MKDMSRRDFLKIGVGGLVASLLPTGLGIDSAEAKKYVSYGDVEHLKGVIDFELKRGGPAKKINEALLCLVGKQYDGVREYLGYTDNYYQSHEDERYTSPLYINIKNQMDWGLTHENHAREDIMPVNPGLAYYALAYKKFTDRDKKRSKRDRKKKLRQASIHAISGILTSIYPNDYKGNIEEESANIWYNYKIDETFDELIEILNGGNNVNKSKKLSKTDRTFKLNPVGDSMVNAIYCSGLLIRSEIESKDAKRVMDSHKRYHNPGFHDVVRGITQCDTTCKALYECKNRWNE